MTGGCLCRAVRFRLDGPLLGSRLCWCRDCQYLACGNASVGVFADRAGLHVDGATADYVSPAESGRLISRRFCPACGTHLFSGYAEESEYVVVRAGALDDPGLAVPTSVIWASSAPGWTCIDPALDRHEQQSDIGGG